MYQIPSNFEINRSSGFTLKTLDPIERSEIEKNISEINASQSWSHVHNWVLENLFKDENHSYFAKLNDHLIGYAITGPMIENTVESIHLIALVVLNNSPKGVGSHLVRLVWREAAEKNRILTLNCHPGNLVFYKKISSNIEIREVDPYPTGIQRFFVVFPHSRIEELHTMNNEITIWRIPADLLPSFNNFAFEIASINDSQNWTPFNDWTFKQLLLREGINFIAKNSDQQIIGYAATHLKEEILSDLHFPTSRIHIAALCILKIHERKKIGSELVNQILKYAKENSISTVTVNCRKEGISFFRKIDESIAEQKIGVYADNSEQMQLTFNIN